MAKIKVSDELGVEIITTDSVPGAWLSKYFSGDTAGFLAGAALAAAKEVKLGEMKAGPIKAGMKFTKGGTMGTTGLKWKVSAEAPVTLAVEQSKQGQPEGTRLTVGFAPGLTLSGTLAAGDAEFGFSAGGSVMCGTGRWFQKEKKVGEGLAELLREGVIPLNCEELKAMKEGDTSVVGGAGKLKFTAEVDVAQAFQPTASLRLPMEALGAIELKTGATLKAEAAVGYEGAFEVRVERLAGEKARLEFLKSSTITGQVSVTASLGLKAEKGDEELFSKLLETLGAPKVDKGALTEAGLSGEEVKALQGVVEASLSRTLEASLRGEFMRSKVGKRILRFEIDLKALEAKGTAAVAKALKGDATGLTKKKAPAGVTLQTSKEDDVLTRKSTWKLNLVGIVNVMTVKELVKRGQVLYSHETGELLVTDEVTAREIRVKTLPMAVDDRKLSRVMMQSLIFTAAYQVAGLSKMEAKSGAEMMYFAEDANAKRARVSDYLDNFVALGLMTEEEKAEELEQPCTGRARMMLRAKFGQEALEAMLVRDGKARAESEYAELGRRAFKALMRKGDEDDYRLAMMDPDDARANALWARFRKDEWMNFGQYLKGELRKEPQLGNIVRDALVVQWWMTAMHEAGEAALEMKAFLAEHAGWTAKEWEESAEFRRARKKLSERLASVASPAVEHMLEAWGMVAMDAASGGTGEIEATLMRNGAMWRKTRPEEG